MRREQSVLIRKKVLLVYVHHGKKIVHDVRYVFNCSIDQLYIMFYDIIIAYQVGCSCKNGGRCVMNYGSYGCECPYGYTGINCETCKLFFSSSFDMQTKNSFL